MRCPVCESTDLAISSREGVEIDYCPQCRGVWLDRGELDKIIERSASEQGAWSNPPTPPQSAPAPRYAESGGYQSGPSGQGYYRKRKRESWLSELFD
jgi:Zn-finger nucleic acid-binding protein